MKGAFVQPSLFDSEVAANDGQAACGRARMQAMIERLKRLSTPPWRDQMGVILDDGAFRRAMQLVPAAEAERLWAEFDPEMERLSAMLFATDPPAEKGPPGR